MIFYYLNAYLYTPCGVDVAEYNHVHKTVPFTNIIPRFQVKYILGFNHISNSNPLKMLRSSACTSVIIPGTYLGF